jgi:putative DNA primase/helicase
VLDVDPRHDGDDSLQELLNEYGSIPETVEVKTGGGGRHIFFQHPGGKIGNRANLLPGLDIRADGGYVVAAPSVHASGNPYEWELSSHPDEINIAPMPEWLLNLMRQPKMLTANNSTSHLSLVNRPSKAVIQSDVIPEGRRNDTLFRMACSLRGKGFDETQIYTALYGANVLQCIPPLPEQEVLNIVNSAMKYPVNKISEPQLIKMPGSALVPCPPPESFFDQGKFVPLLAAEFNCDTAPGFTTEPNCMCTTTVFIGL